jgi:hypothetical protein
LNSFSFSNLLRLWSPLIWCQDNIFKWHLAWKHLYGNIERFNTS